MFLSRHLTELIHNHVAKPRHFDEPCNWEEYLYREWKRYCSHLFTVQ